MWEQKCQQDFLGNSDCAVAHSHNSKWQYRLLKLA